MYCSLIYIDNQGVIQSVYRKLQPTYEERHLVAGRWAWSAGTFVEGVYGGWFELLGKLDAASRAALYGMGENLHIAVWPGALRNTEDLTRHIAKEGRSFSVSVSGLMRVEDFPKNTPHLDLISEHAPPLMADGGSCIAAPDGTWVVEPVVGREALIISEIDFNRVLEERHNNAQRGQNYVVLPALD